MKRFLPHVGACLQAMLWTSLLALPAARLSAQSCTNNEFEAQKVIFQSDVLPTQKMGFFPYTFSGVTPPAKYTTEAWSGSGAWSSTDLFTGTTTHYTNIVWSGSWVFDPATGADPSSKSLSYHVTGPYGLDRDDNLTERKVGIGDVGSLTGAAEVLSATSRRYVGGGGADTRNVTETLSDAVSLAAAQAYGEAHKTTDAGSLQYWDNFLSADAVQAAFTSGTMNRLSPLKAHARRVTFQAQFCVPCIGHGKFLITYYYKKWEIGQPEPDAYTTETETVEFKDAPYLLPQTGFKAYHFELKQGEQCKLVKVTAKSLDDCKGREPGASSAANHSVDMQFHLGKDTTGASAGSLAVAATGVSSALHSPAALRLLSGSGPDVEVIKSGDDLRQIKAPETFVDIVTLTSSSYEIRFYLPSQVGTISGGLYPVTGSPFVTYLVDNPGSGSSVRFTEVRGSLQKVTTYTYDSGTGTMEMSTGNGLRVEAFQKTVAGTAITETRTIKDAANQTVSVVRETKTAFAFGANVTQRTLDPTGANLSTNYTYYTDAVNDGGAYGQQKLVTDPYGRWTRYTYDAQGRVATTVTQFLDSASNSADSSNRVTAVTYGTIPDQDGDSLPEELMTTVESLLGQETGRSYEVTFTQPGIASGQPVETRWDIRCTVAGAAWDVATNLVSKRRTIDSGVWIGRPVSDLRPDGTLTTYTYAADSTSLTTTTETGSANGPGTAVVAGTRTVLVETLVGQMVGRDVFDLPSNTLIASELVTQTDSLGRPTRVDFLDGTHELRSYACCGLDMVTDRQGIATHYNYNAIGQVDRVSRAGLAQEHTLDPESRLVLSKRIGTDNSEITTESHDYDVAGRLVWSKDALNRQTNFTDVIDGNGRRVRTTTNPDGGTLIQTYHKDGSLLSVAGTAAPQRLTYEYGVDADGPFIKQIHVGAANETTEWVKTWSDFAGRTYKRVFADNATELSYFNSAGQLVRQVDADGITTLFVYNAKGEQEVTAVDLNGNNTIDYTADRITRTTSSIATRDTYTVQRTTTESWETDGQDTPVTVSISESALDTLRAWQTVRGLLGTTVTTLNGSGGRTVTTTAPDGTETTQVFANDRLQSLTTSHSALGQLSSATYSYDPHHRLQTQTDARNGATSYTWFNDDQIQSVTTPDPDTTRSGDGYDPQTTSFGYDSAGRQNLVTQPDATVVNTTYWPTGAVKRTWGSRTYPEERTYDTQGRVKTLTTWKDFTNATGAAVTTWNYTTTRGFLLNKRYADNQGPGYTYKPSGRLLTRTWTRGIVTTYGYTAAGDLNSVDYSDSTPDVTLQFDRSGRPQTITDGSGTRTLSYHASGQLKDEDYNSGLLNTFGVHRTYDSQFRLGSVSAISASSAFNQMSFGYDAASRLEAVASGANTATYGYVANSPLVQSVTFKQGGTTRLTTVKTYDKLNRLGLITSVPSVASAVSAAYDYNSANQRTKVTREDDAYWDYGYDSLGQVTSAKKYLPGATPINGLDHAWTFDDIGNRKTATTNAQISNYTSNSLNQYSSHTVPGVIDVMGTAVTDANVTVNGQSVTRQGESWHHSVTIPNTAVATWNEFTVAGIRPGQGPGGSDAVAVSTRKAWLPKTPEAFSYDADGNLTGDGRWVYSWDGENRLVAMETRADILPPLGNFPLTERRKLEFTYDGQGRRVAKKVSNWNGTAWVLVTSTRFLHDGWNMVAELNALASNAPVRTYVWGTDLSGSMQGAGGVGGLLFSNSHLPSSISAGFAASFDGNGNVIAYVDMATGAKSATYEYGAFGETLIGEGVAHEVMPFRFSTKYTDSETGLLYYGLRYYSPSVGRWLNRDPIEERGGLNVYTFLNNSSISNTDYLGMWSKVNCPDESKSGALKRAEQAALQSINNYEGILDKWTVDHAESRHPTLFRVRDLSGPFKPLAFHPAFVADLKMSLGKIRASIQSNSVVAEACSTDGNRCGSSDHPYAYTTHGGSTIWFCPKFFEISAEDQASVVLHEYSHLAAFTTDRLQGADGALAWPNYGRWAYFYNGIPKYGLNAAVDNALLEIKNQAWRRRYVVDE